MANRPTGIIDRTQPEYKSNFQKIDEILEHYVRQGNLYPLDDGTVQMVLLQVHRTWYFIKPTENDAECDYWNSVTKNLFILNGFRRLFIPIRCLNCWKVVAKPRTMKETMVLLDIMKRLNLRSKIGNEERKYTAALWGAYFYNNTMEEGIECYTKIYNEVRNGIFADVPEGKMDERLILKRGCTEYEIGHGPSDKWQMQGGQVKLEEYIRSRINIRYGNEKQNDSTRKLVIENWKEWAHSHEDWTYIEYNEGEPLVTPYVTYHPLL